ncbi:MAG: TetR/AcrR family transcriptional regulator [Desulfurococcales archaeon]|nr:TetR/AcrR family transcriptional regulator [Desulfurococcales archaeon]
MVREKDVVREKILSAAMKVFSTYGYFRAPIHYIAKEAGVSKGLIFWYFRSKEELIMEIAARSLPLQPVNSCLSKNLQGKELLECVGKGYMDKYRDPVHRGLLLHTMALGNTYPKIAENIRKLCEEKTSILAEKVFGEASTETRIAIRTFLGGLM